MSTTWKQRGENGIVMMRGEWGEEAKLYRKVAIPQQLIRVQWGIIYYCFSCFRGMKVKSCRREKVNWAIYWEVGKLHSLLIGLVSSNEKTKMLNKYFQQVKRWTTLQSSAVSLLLDSAIQLPLTFSFNILPHFIYLKKHSNIWYKNMKLFYFNWTPFHTPTSLLQFNYHFFEWIPTGLNKGPAPMIMMRWCPMTI